MEGSKPREFILPGVTHIEKKLVNFLVIIIIIRRTIRTI